MNDGLKEIENKRNLNIEEDITKIFLHPGIEISYFKTKTDQISFHHMKLCHIMEINYCHKGRLGWKMKNGNEIYLGPGDFSIHTLDICTDSTLYFPTKYYEGLILWIDLSVLSYQPPKILNGTGITGDFLFRKFGKDTGFSSFAGNAQTDAIFQSFYEQPKHLSLAYQKLKSIELLLYLSKMDPGCKHQLTKYQSEQIEMIRQVHNYLTEHIGERITIEMLSRQFLINPTTLKNVFKSVYGSSLASHIKEHRMEHAAGLLLNTDLSIAQISRQVGYESQSKFTSAFKDSYKMLPKEYRKRYHK